MKCIYLHSPTLLYKQVLDVKVLHRKISYNKKETQKRKNIMGYTQQQDALVNSSYEVFKQNLPTNSVLFYTL